MQQLKEYSLWPHVTEEVTGEPLNHLLDDIDSNDLGNELNQISEAGDGEEPLVRATKRKRSRKLKGKKERKGKGRLRLASGPSLLIFHSLHSTLLPFFVGRDCVVSKWTHWSDCTSKTCDFSEQYRTRYVVSHPRAGGTKCPPLTEKRICVPDKGCQQNYFDW